MHFFVRAVFVLLANFLHIFKLIINHRYIRVHWIFK